VRALVAGAAGFLGSHLSDRLHDDGVEVFGFDNFDSGRHQNIAHLDGDPGFRFFEHDITQPIAAAELGPLDVIFNMACPASPFAVRIFNTYGPRMDPEDGRIVSSFIVQALRGEPITIFGDGSQTRSLCYVDDLVGGLVRMGASEPAFTGPVNLGSPEELTVLDTARIIKEMTGSRSPTVFKDLPQDDPMKRKPDISLAESKLGRRPKGPFTKGAAPTIDYFRGAIGETPTGSGPVFPGR